MSYRLLQIGGVLLLAACQGPGTPAVTATAGHPAPRWTHDVAWDGDLAPCRQGQAQPSRDCLYDVMRAAGASEAAVAAATQLSSAGELAYVTGWQEQDGIGVAAVRYPFRANSNQGTRLVDANGRRIDVDALPAASPEEGDPILRAALQAHPGALPFAPASAAGRTVLQGGGVRLVYSTPLRQCHACPDVGELRMAYDFDAEGRFIGQQPLPAAARAR